MSLQVNIKKRLGSFTLESAFAMDGGVLGLLGASGCGKSMTLKCIAGIEKPDEGRIVLDGRVLYDSAAHINLPPQQRHVGYLFQNYALFPNMTVRQNILAGLHHEKDRRKREKAMQDAVHFFQLDGLEVRRPNQLSGGQQQRVALARIMVNQPQLLMLDEPFSALDSHLRLRLQMEMKELLNSFGRDVLMVTHSRDEALSYVQRDCRDGHGQHQDGEGDQGAVCRPGEHLRRVADGVQKYCKGREGRGLRGKCAGMGHSSDDCSACAG